jgi:hypothetical protein
MLRIALCLLVPITAFLLLRGATASKAIMALTAILCRVGAATILFYCFIWFVERPPIAWTARLQRYFARGWLAGSIKG